MSKLHLDKDLFVKAYWDGTDQTWLLTGVTLSTFVTTFQILWHKFKKRAEQQCYFKHDWSKSCMWQIKD